jgi:hypothetical protein
MEAASFSAQSLLHKPVISDGSDVFASIERIAGEIAYRTDELIISHLPVWGRNVHRAREKFPEWLWLLLLKRAAKSVELRIHRNQMNKATEVWVKGRKVGEVNLLLSQAGV